MKFTIYTQSTGQVLFSGTADNPNMLAAEGQAVLLDEAFTWAAMGVSRWAIRRATG